MEEKLQELTNKIYREGVERARQEADDILDKARKQAEQLLAEAERDAEQARRRAKEEAEEMRRNVTSELKLSAQQAVNSLKQDITHLLTTRILGEPIDKAFKEEKFLQKIIETALRNWDPSQQGVGLKLLLPQEERQRLGKYFEAHAHEMLKGELKLSYDGNLQQGFRIGPADDSYVLSFSADDFERFFRAYLRPQARQLLFGE